MDVRLGDALVAQGNDGVATFATGPYPNGRYSLTVEARSEGGSLVATSSAVDVTISNQPAGDTVAPTVRITSPADNAVVNRDVEVRYSASDNVGVVGADLLADGVVVAAGVDGVAILDTRLLDDGEIVLSVEAFDAAGNVGVSERAVRVRVDNTPSGLMVESVTVLDYPDREWDLSFPPDLNVTIRLSGSDVFNRTVTIEDVTLSSLPVTLNMIPDLFVPRGGAHEVLLWDRDNIADDLMVVFDPFRVFDYADSLPSSIPLVGPQGRISLNVRWVFD